MTHYVCDGGCQGNAPEPGVCMMATCPRHGMPLRECNCTDGQHKQDQEQVQEKETV